MLTKPETYEEAKKIIEFSVTQEDLIKRNKKIMLIQAIILTIVGIAIDVLLACLTKSIMVFVGCLPVAGMISIEAFIPFFLYRYNNKKIKKGTYFDRKSEDDIIRKAVKYVEGYNELERRGIINKQKNSENDRTQ